MISYTPEELFEATENLSRAIDELKQELERQLGPFLYPILDYLVRLLAWIESRRK